MLDALTATIIEGLPMSRHDLILVMALFGFALVLRVMPVVERSFDGVYGQDSYVYYAMAESLAGGRLYTGIYIWGVGTPAFLALVMRLIGISLANAQGLVLVLGATAAPIAYLITRRCGAASAGAVIAGLILSCGGQAIQSSIVIMSDMLALVWAMISAASLLTYYSNRRPLWLIVSASLLMLAIITRWNMALLIPIWGVIWLLSGGYHQYRASLLAFGAALLTALPQIIFGIIRPSPVFFNYETWDFVRAGMKAFVTADGMSSFAQINALFYAQPLYDPFWGHPLFSLLALIGVIDLIRKRSWTEVILIVGWFLLGYIFLCGIPQQNPRYSLLLLPPLAIGAGIGFAAVWESITLSSIRQATLRLALSVFMMIALAGMITSAWAGVGNFITRAEADKTVARTIAHRLPSDATLYTFELTLALRVYASFTVFELFYETPNSVEQLPPNTNVFLLVDVQDIQTRWAGNPLETTFEALVASQAMQPIDHISKYTLFQSTVQQGYIP